jgi:hypothetical protein
MEDLKHRWGFYSFLLYSHGRVTSVSKRWFIGWYKLSDDAPYLPTGSRTHLTGVAKNEKSRDINCLGFFYLLDAVIISMVALPDQFWNTLWADLIRMSEEFARLNINPDVKD